MRLGEPVRAMEALTRARTFMYERDERYWEAERQRMSGEAELAMGTEHGQAEIRFVEALGIARRQGAKSLELRAVMSLVRLEHVVGEQHGALDMLATVLGSITEGHGTPDLLEATAMLGGSEAAVLS